MNKTELLNDLLQIRHDPEAKQKLLHIMLKTFFGLTAIISETGHADHACLREAARMLMEHYKLFVETPWPENDLKDDGHPLMAVVAKIADGRATQDELRSLWERKGEVGRYLAETFYWFWLKISAHDAADAYDDVA